MELIVLCALIGLIPGAIAHSKGYSFGVWWIFGALLFIVALPVAILLKPDTRSLEERRLATGNERKCPACAELVKADARVCRYCSFQLHSAHDLSGIKLTE